jgi:hypothetical protein
LLIRATRHGWSTGWMTFFVSDVLPPRCLVGPDL